jgi:hypothetical protein
LLGGHVRGRPLDLARAAQEEPGEGRRGRLVVTGGALVERGREGLWILDPGESEVRDADPAVVPAQDVVGLEVADRL